jgi:hypothetical protein
MFEELFSTCNTSGGFVRGFWWHARMDNDCVFSLWTAQDVTRKWAKEALIDFSGYEEMAVVTSLWKTIKPREMD